MLRYKADFRTLAYLTFMVTIFILLWVFGFDKDGGINGAIAAPLLTLLCLLCIADAVISHNHNHLPIFHNKWANIVVGYVISFFYGFPAFAWIPTHNRNHHALNNRPGDYSITTRPLRKVGILAALSYPTVTSLTQTRLISPFLRRCWRGNRFLFWQALSEYVVFYGIMIALFLIDWRKALLFALVPQQIALFSIQHFNYLQHIETDSYSEFDHSRNFTGRVLNLWLFNNGYHTVHHLKPGTHWSRTPSAHKAVAHRIAPRLDVANVLTYWIKRFVWDALLGRKPPHMTLPADLSPDTIRVSPGATAELEKSYQAHSLLAAPGSP